MALAVILLVAALMALRFYDHTADDAYIGFRYAHNLADGNGLVFNPGERVEGFTNFLWVMLAALPLSIGRDPLPAARLVGLACTLATLVCVVLAARRLSSRSGLAYAGALLVALSPGSAVWAAGGMETAMFTCLVTWSVWLVAGGAEAGRLPIAAALLAVAAALTRPEGLLVAVALGAATFPGRAGSSVTWNRWATWVIVFAALFVPYFLWRWAYFGALLPNTFYAKVGLSGAQATRGFGYLRDFCAEGGSWLGAALPLGVIGARRRRSALVLSAVALPYLLYIIAIGGDALPMYRFFVPITGLFALLMVAGLDDVLSRPWLVKARWAEPTAVAAVVVWALAGAWPAFSGRSFEFVQQDRREVAAWVQIGTWFRGHAAPGESIAVVPAGAIPYFSGLVAIDMLGLNDRTIAHRSIPDMGRAPAGHEKYDADYVLSRRPTYILMGVYDLAPDRPDAAESLPLYYPAEMALSRSEGFARHYRPITGRCPGGYFTFFAREDKVFPETATPPASSAR
jgi:arabinofuranosyltransferase